MNQTGELDPLARWGDWCHECVMDDLSRAQTQQEWRNEEKLDRLLRVRPGPTSGGDG